MLRSGSWLAMAVVFVGCGGGSGHQLTSAPPPVEAPSPPSAPSVPQPAAPAPPPSEPIAGSARVYAGEEFEVADEYTRLFYAGELDRLFGRFTDEMKTALPLEQLRQNRAAFNEQFGRELAVVHRESQVDGEHRAFMRWARFQKSQEVVGVQWILREDDTIAGFFVRLAPRPTDQPAKQPGG
jgi:hypothetical protein